MATDSSHFFLLDAVPHFQHGNDDNEHQERFLKELRAFSQYLLLNQKRFELVFRCFGTAQPGRRSQIEIGLRLNDISPRVQQIIKQLRPLTLIPMGSVATSNSKLDSVQEAIYRRLRFLPVLIPDDMAGGSEYQAQNQGEFAAEYARELQQDSKDLGFSPRIGLKHAYQENWALWEMRGDISGGARRIAIPTPLSTSVLRDQPERWRSLLYALGESVGLGEDGEVVISFETSSFNSEEAGYLLECYRAFMATYGDDEPTKELSDFVSTYQPTSLQDRSYKVGITARGSMAASFNYALAQDVDAAALELEPSTDLKYVEKTRPHPVTLDMLHKLQTHWRFDEALELATLPYSFSDPLPHYKSFVPSPLATPALYRMTSGSPTNANASSGTGIPPILLGHLTGARNSSNAVTLSDAGLSEHILVCGVTGSGKTTTVTSLLQRMYPEIPFLVIDPVKKEYSQHFQEWLQPQGGHIAHYNFEGPVKGQSWLRFNPFIPPDGISIYSHSSIFARMLATLFPTSPTAFEFVLQMVRRTYFYRRHLTYLGGKKPPKTIGEEQEMKKECLIEAGRTPGTHWLPMLLDSSGKTLEDNPILVPTFADFLAVGNAYLDHIYASTQSSWMREAVEYMRLRNQFLESSLMSFIFNPENKLTTLKSLGVLEQSCIIELFNIVDNSEKNTLFSVIMSLLYEYRSDQWNSKGKFETRTPGPSNSPAPPLGRQGARTKHITVIEEAHRLVSGGDHGSEKQVTSPSQEAATLMAQCLAEIRVMGEGIIVAEQSPGKLISDVLINTSTKIVHRLFFGPDKDSLAAIMGLSSSQAEFLSFLEQGEAFTFFKMPQGSYTTAHVKVFREEKPQKQPI